MDLKSIFTTPDTQPLHPKTTCIVNDTADSSADVSTTFERFEYLFAPKIIGIDAVVAANPHQLIALIIAQGTHKLG